MTTWQVNPVAIPALGARAPLPPAAATASDTDDLSTSPWLALCPPGAVQLRDPAPGRVRDVAPGVPVALVSDRPFARRRLRELAEEVGLRVDHELIVFPSTSNPLVALDDDETAVRYFWTALAAVSADAAAARLPATLPRLLAKALPWRWTGALLGGRVIVGVRR